MLTMIDDMVLRPFRSKARCRRPFRWGGAPVGRVQAIIGLLLLATGISQGVAQDAPESSASSPDVSTYLIGKEDVLQINLFGEEELSGMSLPVRPDGMISLPLIGDVRAAGLTPEQLSDALTVRYSEHVRAPVVTVMVTEINSFKVYLLGRVGKAGEIVLGRETRLLQVLALAGGFADFANTKKILIIRELDDGSQQRIEINYEKIVSGESMEMNLKLKPGDTIVVP